MKTYEQSAETLTVPAQPDRSFLHDKNASVFNPFLQSLFTGFLAFALAIFPAHWLGADDIWSVSAFVGLVAASLMWLYLIRHWIYLTLERMGIDINGNGIDDSQPTETRHKIVIDMTTIDHGLSHSDIATFIGFSDARMGSLAAGILMGKPLSIGEWSGKDKLFSRSEFVDIITEMFSRKMIVYKNGRTADNGYIPTRAGKAAFEHLAATGAPLLDGYVPED